MENLIADGRIHPARIEEMFGKAEKLVNQRVQEAGDQAAFDTGIHDLHPELVRTLGRLRYRTSYGQNVLNHSLEVAYLSGVMASELGLDPVPAKRAGLLHDLGRPLTMKSRVAMRSSVPILPVDSAKSRPSFMQSRRITTTSSPIASSTCLCKPPMPFPQHVPVLVRKLWTPTSASGKA